MKKLNNKIIDQRLTGRNLKRLDDYLGNHTKINFQCLAEDCLYVWSVQPSGIFDGRGCPKCAGKMKLTNEIVDERLIGRNIKRVEDFVNTDIPINFHCLIDACGHTWKATPDSIMNGGRGCPKCAGTIKLTNAIVDERLIGRNIKRLGDYVSAHIEIDFQCLVDSCSCIWSASPHHVAQQNKGCPKCAGNLRLTNDSIDERLAERNIKRLGNCINARTKIDFQCTLLECLYVWSAVPDSVLRGSGCPKCHKFRKNETLIFDILKAHCKPIFFHDYNIKQIDKNAERALRFDFYFPNLKFAIEYNGGQHYKIARFGNRSQEEAERDFLNIQARDRYKQQFCDQNNIKIIWIDGRIYKNKVLEQYIVEEILPLVR